MANKNNNIKSTISGFTLIEILIVLAMLGVLLLVIVPSTFNVIINARLNAYDSLVESIEDSARLYVNKYRDEIELALAEDGYYEITLIELINEGLLKENLHDPRDNSHIPEDEIVIVTFDQDQILIYCFDHYGIC